MLGYRFIKAVLPVAVRRLRRIKRRATLIPDATLRREALSSIRSKDFHVFGGSILATFVPAAGISAYVDLVAAYETAVDYLDNLSDRIGSDDERDLRALHEALSDAVTPGVAPRGYFRYRGADDAGYLASLVTEAQAAFAALPAFGTVRDRIAFITRRYCELQVRKHLAPRVREVACAEEFSDVADDLAWWEGAAACGSTMPTFGLAFAALDPACDATRSQAVLDAYYPYFSALHILLDYLVDRQEDELHGELNFVACYPTADAAHAHIVTVARKAATKLSDLSDADAHLFALRAMCAYYCTRAGVRKNAGRDVARSVLDAVGLDGSAGRANRRLAPLLQLYAKAARP